MLRHLSLGWNNITSDELVSLSRHATKLTLLQTLFLFGNNICDRGARLLAACIRAMPSLGVVELSKNCIESGVQLPQSPKSHWCCMVLICNVKESQDFLHRACMRILICAACIRRVQLYETFFLSILHLRVSWQHSQCCGAVNVNKVSNCYN